MLTVRIIGAALLSVSGYGFGMYLLNQQIRRVKVLCQMERLLGRIQDEIEYRALPLDEILYLLRQETGFELLRLDRCQDLRQLVLPDVLSASQRQLLEEAMITLGQRTSQESSRQLEYYQRQCAGLIDQEREKLCNAQRLYRQLGVCGGLLAALVLL